MFLRAMGLRGPLGVPQAPFFATCWGFFGELWAYAVLSAAAGAFFFHFLARLYKKRVCLIKEKCLRKVADELHRVVT